MILSRAFHIHLPHLCDTIAIKIVTERTPQSTDPGRILPSGTSFIDQMPKKTASLFVAPRDHDTAAGLSAQAYPWQAYALGYQLAAETLLTNLGQPHQGREFLSYPLVFVCRHYLELRLKDIITSAGELFDSPAQAISSHNLPDLWRRARKLAEAASPGTGQDFFEPIEQCVFEFHREDADSCSFRYPFDTAGKPSLPNLPDFDLDQFAEAFTRAASNLDAIADYFHEATQAIRVGLADAQ